MPEPEGRDPGPETVTLGQFDPLELPIILEVLRDRGIFAMTKSPLDKPDNEQYGVLGKQGEQRGLTGGRLGQDRADAVEALQLLGTLGLGDLGVGLDAGPLLAAKQRQQLVRQTSLADIQQQVVGAEQGVNIAELQANAHIKQATGESESVRLRAIGEAQAI